MKNYVIHVTVMTGEPGATPQDVTWYRGTDKAEALAALVSAASADVADKSLPEHMQTQVTAVRLDIFDVEEV